MSINAYKENDTSKYNLTEYLCDTKADVISLPTDVAIGSVALVAETTDVYILNGSREWVSLTEESEGE